jgi:hypothetical protein
LKNQKFQQKIVFLNENHVDFCLKFRIHSLKTGKQQKLLKKQDFQHFLAELPCYEFSEEC